jgi:hypothetical protein
LLVTTWPAHAQPIYQSTHPQSTITITGTVTHQGAPVSDVWIGVGSTQDWQEATTDASGAYSVALQTDGQLWFHVRPAVADRLTQVNLWMDGVSADLTQDFTLDDGYLLELQVTGSGGAMIAGDLGLDVKPLLERLPDGQWFMLEWDSASERYRGVFPSDVYYVTVQDPPTGYYDTTQAFDLRGDDLDAVLSLNTTYVHPIPYDPPDASKISFGLPDDLGEAAVTGAAGAALPLARVLLVNLSSGHQVHTISEADGSFAARIYAPPGSTVMVKHGPASHRWAELENGVSERINPFPGTMIHLPHVHSGDELELPFASAGAVDLHADDLGDTRNYVGAAWAITGTVSPVVVEGQWTRVLTGTHDGQTVPGLYLGGLNWTHPALGDLDGDGDLDLLVGEESGHLVLYRNEGDSTSADWQFETAEYAGVETGSWAYPALVDVTGDGLLDLLVGRGEGLVDIYYNDGAPTAPAWPTSPDMALSAGSNAAPALADLDGDTDLDLVVGHEGGALYLFRNTGSATSPVWSQETDNYGGISEPGEGLQPAFVDLDGDVDLDLLIGRSGDLVWYRNDGPPTDPTWTRVTDGYMGFGGSSGVSLATGDWDGDGDQDLVTGEHWGILRFFRNDGPPAWTEQAFSLPLDLAGDSAPALADWDDDGDQDLLIGQVHGQVHQYTNAGAATEPDWQADGILLTLPWTDHPHAFPTLADVDGDGDFDLFIGEGGWQGPGAGGNIHYYRNDGTPSSPDWTLVTDNWLGLDVGGWSTPTFVDIDADGDLDLFVGDEAGTVTFVENTSSAALTASGTPTAPAWAAPVQPYADLHLGAYSAPAFFDLDQDGDLDMLVGLESGSLAYVRNTGTPSVPAWELVTMTYPGIDIGGHAVPTAADLNGDAKPDLLLGDGHGGLNLYLYEGTGTPPDTGDTYAPGDPFQLEGTMSLYSPAITATTDVSAIRVDGWLHLMMLFNQEGRSLAAENYFMSTMLTPTGFPIQRVERSSIGLETHLVAENLHYVGGHVVEGDLNATVQLPEDLPAGIYRPTIWFDFTGVPTSTQWLAANVVRHTFYPAESALPPITVGQVSDLPHFPWRLLMDDFVQGTRGTGAREDQGTFEVASQIISQGAPYYVPPVDERSGGTSITYRLEPFLPTISFTDRRMPTPPLLPFDLPGGELRVLIEEPDGTVRDLGTKAFAQSFNRTKTTRAGHDLNDGTVQLDDVYSLKAASDRFRVTFEQYGHHVITMTGEVEDLWGNTYTGGGTYDLWIAHPLDVDPGVLPGTPLAVGDAFNPSLQFYPRVPATVTLTLTLYPNSDAAQAEVHTLTGAANRFGHLSISNPQDPISLSHPGEYRVDLTAVYTDMASSQVYMAAMTWGGVVMTPEGEADLIAHGRRGLDSLAYIPNHWFVSSRDLTIPEGAISHTYNPYYNGDILWSRMLDGAYGGDSLLLGASVQDTVGAVEAAIEARAARMNPGLAPPGTFEDRVAVGELPLFTSTQSGRSPQFVLGQTGQTIPDDVDQIAYSYRSSQRPGVRVRELVAEDAQTGGYWRLDTLYDDQLSVGILGDRPNDFKFQYIGAVYRDLADAGPSSGCRDCAGWRDTGRNEYLGQGSGWIFIPDDDPTGSRVMPPFAGFGGWTSEGGPLLTLKGQDIHIFILPTGIRPGAVLEVGDTFRFAGHIMPTLNSSVTVTVTAPSGAQHFVEGQANRIGYFYNPGDNLTVTEPGLWSADVRVWHEGPCSGGTVTCAFDPSQPCPSGDVLGSDDGRYWFYVVPAGSPRLDVSAPSPGFLEFDSEVTPIIITGTVPAGLSGTAVDYTLSMPGYILDHGQAAIQGDTYEIVFDPVALHAEFPNLDLEGRDEPGRPGLADTFAVGLLLHGQSAQGAVYRANTITIQGEQVFVGETPVGFYLPLIVRGS